jgi:hypothetical protein
MSWLKVTMAQHLLYAQNCLVTFCMFSLSDDLPKAERLLSEVNSESFWSKLELSALILNIQSKKGLQKTTEFIDLSGQLISKHPSHSYTLALFGEMLSEEYSGQTLRLPWSVFRSKLVSAPPCALTLTLDNPFQVIQCILLSLSLTRSFIWKIWNARFRRSIGTRR